MRTKIVAAARTSVAACGIALLAASCMGPKEITPLSPEQQAEVDRTNPQMKAVLNEYHSLDPQPIITLTPAQARMQPTLADAQRKLLMDNNMSTKPEPVAGIDSKMIPGPTGDIPVRVYYPLGNGPFPAVVYFHGGGWVLGSLDQYDSSCRAITDQAHCVVISVDYRLAPEHKFPAATEDAYAATQYVISHPNEFKSDPNHVAVAGESAGGNIAAAVCMMARDRSGMMPVYELLIYPVTDDAFETESYKMNASAVPLNRDMMKWFFDQYLSSPGEGSNPYISILRGDVSKLPPATVITADIDPLRSDGQAFADKLKAAGIPVKYMNYEGVTHEFFGLGATVETAKHAQRFAAEGLDSAFSK
jgi:acetyl esterase